MHLAGLHTTLLLSSQSFWQVRAEHLAMDAGCCYYRSRNLFWCGWYLRCCFKADGRWWNCRRWHIGTLNKFTKVTPLKRSNTFHIFDTNTDQSNLRMIHLNLNSGIADVALAHTHRFLSCLLGRTVVCVHINVCWLGWQWPHWLEISILGVQTVGWRKSDGNDPAKSTISNTNWPPRNSFLFISTLSWFTERSKPDVPRTKAEDIIIHNSIHCRKDCQSQ